VTVRGFRQLAVIRAAVWALITLIARPEVGFAQGPALPQGPQVNQGSVSIATSAAGTMTIAQGSDRAIVNWNDFSIGAGHLVQIQQPGASSALLNRVTGDNASLINGGLQANGQVYLLNPHGVVIGPSGTIDTAGFLASVLHVADADFMKGGALDLSGGAVAGIVNLGTIHASSGDVVLLAPVVANRGTISAPGGTAALASGGDVLYSPGGSILIKAPAPVATGDAAVDNSGVIEAAQVALKAAGSPYALAVNNDGLISATSLTRDGGRIVLEGGDGDIRVGASGVVRANAAGSGNGGTIHIGAGAQGRTTFAGAAEAKGGDAAGNGGFVEISGHDLDYTGRTTTLAANGKAGTLLLDPTTIGVGNTVGTDLDGGNVTISAADSITVSSAVSNSTTTNVLVLDAPVVAVNADITLPDGELEFGTSGVAGTSVTSASSASINAKNVRVVGGYDTVNLAGSVTATNGLSYAPVNATLSSFTANNASNAIKFLNLTNGTTTVTGNVDVRTTTTMTVSNKLTVNGNLTIAAGGNLTFGGGSPQLTVAGTTKLASTGGAFINSEGATLLAGAGRKLIYSSTDAGSYNAGGLLYTQVNGVSFPNDPQGSGNVIYFSSGASSLPAMTITADDKSITYGSADPTYTASFSGGSSADLTQPVLFQVNGAHVNAGRYTITPFGASSSTKTLTYVAGTLTITPVPLTVTAGNESRVYGDANPTFFATASPLFNGDTLGSIVPNLSFITTATPASGVGSYSVMPSGTSANGNYTLSFAPGTLSVTPAPLTITADDASRLYGGANPAFSFSVSGLKNGDTASVVSGVTFATDAGTRSFTGGYPIIPQGGSAENYTIEHHQTGTLTVRPAPLTVIGGIAAVQYGVAPPADLGVTYNGLVAGDTPASMGFTTTSPVVPGTPVGIYPTTLNGRSQNYDISFIPGNVTVNRAPLVIGANDASRYYLTPNPEFTTYVRGLFGADQVTGLKVSTTADIGSPTGTYDLVPSSDPMPNYDVSYVNGTLTVADPVPVVTFSDGTELPSQKDLQEKMKTTFESQPAPQNVVVGYNIFGQDLTLFRAESKVVNDFVKSMADAGTPTNAGAVYDALRDPATHDGMMGILLPYFNREIDDILGIPDNKRTPEQKALMASFLNYINEQRAASAQKARDDYAKWKAGEQARANATLDGSIGVAGIVLNATEASNPQAPPEEIMQQLQSGVVLTNDQIRSVSTMYATVQDALEGTGNEGTPAGFAGGTLSAVGAALEIGAVGAGFTSTADVTAGIKTVMGSEDLARSIFPYTGRIGQTIRALEREMVDLSLGEKTVEEAARYTQIQQQIKYLREGGELTSEITDGLQGTSEVVKVSSTAGKVLGTAGRILSVAGVVLEVVGNAIQVAIGVIGYVNQADYEAKLDAAATKAGAPITEAELGAMEAKARFAYMSAMLATNGEVAK
jgi:filamentous hemagglutinin family protein